MRVRTSLVIFLGLMIATTVGAQQYRMAVAPGYQNIRKDERVEELEKSVSSYREDDGHKVVVSITDYHALTTVPLDKIVEVFTDREHQVGTIPRLTYYSWEYIPGTDKKKYYEDQIISIKFMGFESSYHNYLLTQITDNRDQSPPTYSIHWKLIKSLDGRMKVNEGDYFLTVVQQGGERKTYMRQYIHSELNDTFVGLEFTLRSFIPSDTQGLFSAIFDAARARP